MNYLHLTSAIVARLALVFLLAGCASSHPVPAQDETVAAAGAVSNAARTRDQIVPLVDHHQHLVSPATAAMVSRRLPPNAPAQGPITADTIIKLLDAAGIRRAVVLSGAFTMGGRNFDEARSTHSDEQLAALVRAENDWTAREVARHPERLVAFCSFHPQAPSALSELRRCAASKAFIGVKLHLEESDMDLTNPEHAGKVRDVFLEANRLRLPIAIHFRNNRSNASTTTEVFLRHVLVAAPDVPVQVAHLSGGGAYSEAALTLLADAVTRGDPGTQRLLFDLTDVVRTAGPPGAAPSAVLQRMVELIRRIGMNRMYYGSDPAVFGRLAPREGWAEFRSMMPLTDAEVEVIASNVAPYLR